METKFNSIDGCYNVNDTIDSLIYRFSYVRYYHSLSIIENVIIRKYVLIYHL